MREIKFRAWDKIEKRMMYRTIFDRNWYATPKNDADGCHCIRSISSDDISKIELMQFPDLLDKNKRERCEGDIIKRNTGRIFIEKKRWFSLGEDNNVKCYGYDYHPEDEIIGNIYEHPELMEAIT
jgi:hypothetical protein